MYCVLLSIQSQWGPNLHCFGPHRVPLFISEYLLFCLTEEQTSYRFGTTMTECFIVLITLILNCRNLSYIRIRCVKLLTGSLYVGGDCNKADKGLQVGRWT